MFGMMIDIGPNVFAVPSPALLWSWTFVLKFYVKVFRTSLFLNPEMDLVNACNDDRFWSKI